jgi:hypothetical protein
MEIGRIVSIAGKESRKVDKEVAKEGGARVPLEFVTHEDGHPSTSILVTVDRHEWYYQVDNFLAGKDSSITGKVLYAVEA